MSVIPKGKYRGQKLQDLSDATVHQIWSSWNGIKALKQHEFFAVLVAERERRKEHPSEIRTPEKTLRFKSIQCVSVPNTPQTQCNVYMYGLALDGSVWFKRDRDSYWSPEPMCVEAKECLQTFDCNAGDHADCCPART